MIGLTDMLSLSGNQGGLSSTEVLFSGKIHSASGKHQLMKHCSRVLQVVIGHNSRHMMRL